MRLHHSHACGGLLGVLLVGCVAGFARPAWAQPPTLPVARLFSIFPVGAKQGTSVDVSLSGIDLEGVSKLHFSVSGITAEQKTSPPGLGENGPQPVPGQFRVTIAPDAAPGVYEVRAIGKYGVSNPRYFVVGARNELVEKEPNNTPAQALEVPLDTVVNGQSGSATDEDYFKFTAKQGQRIIIDCSAYRIDSRMDATLVLFDSAGREIERNRDTNRRDPMLDFAVPADGVYLVEVHDFLYAGSSEHFYRLSISAGPYVDYIFPPAGLPGSTAKYTLYGRNLPGGQPANVKSADGKTLESLAVDFTLPADDSLQFVDTGTLIEPDESGIDSVAFRWPTPQGATNAVPLGIATAPVVAEQEPNDDPAKAQAIAAPCEFVGQFYPQADRDWVTIQCKAGEALWMEVFSQRHGLPTDPYLLVQQVTKNDKGEEQVKDIQSVDDYLDNPPGNIYIYDFKTDDPAFRFVAPADGTYRILVRNLSNYSRADPRLVYRLAIHPAKPDFRLVVKPRLLPFSPDPNQNPPTVWNPLLRKGGTEFVDVMLFRREGFDGPVEVSVEGLPPGVTSAPITIAEGQNLGAIVLTAADNAAESMSLVSVVGKAKVGDAHLVRPARNATMVWGGQINQATPRARLTHNLALAVGGETFPFFVHSSSSILEMCKAGKVQVPLKLVRRGDFKGNVVLAPSSLPPNVRPSNITLDANAAEGNLEINLPPNVPLGTYSFSVLATTQVSYSRDPEAVKAATDRKAAVDKIVGELDAAAKAAAAAKAEADKKAADMDAATKKAVEVAQAAEKAAGEAVAKAKAAADAKAAAEKAAAEALAQLKAANDAKIAAAKAAADAQAQAKAAADAKAAAQKSEAEAAAKLKDATAVQQTVAKAVTDATNKAKPANINVAAPSPTVTLKITPAPITMNVNNSGTTLKQGASLEIPVSITRLYGYADAVQVRAKLPDSLKGVKLAEVTIAKDQVEGKLVVEAAADATPGTFAIAVQAVSKFNGQDLSVGQDLSLTVEKVEAAK